ncbi:hypothetical protein GSI_04663 [Ganoderma sinense ZZ0214-1]|uniref:Uncharacterized protein n=1 Tax=Ganoderma sinense ZZ0214-1 TaxID=1077348 RepID=A0A2G8SHH1_9APHY|nr:hypothetical protein GSI_04663 [Ganoderma sinense ZZ0214-1]
MDTRLPCKTELSAKVDDDERERQESPYVAVVGAADGVGRAAATTADTDDGDRGASHAEENVEVLDDDAQRAQQSGAGGGTSLYREMLSEKSGNRRWRSYGLGGVATLQVPGVAVGASVERDGVGGRKEWSYTSSLKQG